MCIFFVLKLPPKHLVEMCRKCEIGICEHWKSLPNRCKMSEIVNSFFCCVSFLFFASWNSKYIFFLCLLSFHYTKPAQFNFHIFSCATYEKEKKKKTAIKLTVCLHKATFQQVVSLFYSSQSDISVLCENSGKIQFALHKAMDRRRRLNSPTDWWATDQTRSSTHRWHWKFKRKKK